MEAISTLLQPYKEIIGTVLIYLAGPVNFLGLPVCDKILKQGNTDNVSSASFVANVVLGLLRMKAAFLFREKVLMRISAVSVILNLVFCIFYYSYSRNKWSEILKPITFSIGFISMIWIYGEWEDPSVFLPRYGLIIAAATLSSLKSPLIDTREVVKKKNASYIPLGRTILLTTFSFFMVLYSLIVNVQLLIFQCLVIFLIAFLRLILIFVYPGTSTSIEKEKKEQ